MGKNEGLPLLEGESVIGQCGTITLTNRRVIETQQEVHIFGLLNGDHTYKIIDLPSVNFVASGEYMSVLRMILVILLGLVVFKLKVLVDLLITFRLRPLWGRAVSVTVASAAGTIEIQLQRGGVEEAREFVKRLQAQRLGLIVPPRGPEARPAAPSTCPSCHKPLAPGAAFCEECGQKTGLPHTGVSP